jgi:hypothetical protein
MPTPYVYERQVEYWTSRAIENFFLDAGFEVLVFPLTQLVERQVPSDFLFLDTATNKIFGFQYKALYQNGDDHWNLEATQHATLGKFAWMYYALSDLKAPSHHRNALHYLRVLCPGFAFQPKLSALAWKQNGLPPYFRWAAFFEGLCSCKHGCRIKGSAELQRALWVDEDRAAPREILELADEVFVANLDARRVVRYTSSLAPERGG